MIMSYLLSSMPLDHWQHYLQGTEHPVTLLTDYKNLTYFCQPQKLSC